MTAPVPAAGIVEAAAVDLFIRHRNDDGTTSIRPKSPEQITREVLARAFPMVADEIERRWAEERAKREPLHSGYSHGMRDAHEADVALVRSLAEGLGDE